MWKQGFRQRGGNGGKEGGMADSEMHPKIQLHHQCRVYPPPAMKCLLKIVARDTYRAHLELDHGLQLGKEV